ncbi:acyltransferase family protein [Adhaeribacter radiodurans]|uniref:Acyltransferase family protein n=1 Tax=Adhaeribacter radiodurans TaxID=2745197 RepID=A0A7L7LEK3_9BACT|nr:acyltransferase family protein [Adhaeribacter radiodurans]QMU31187.1 acyltransferase family protein [Adhaeribacter radiodurans]
MPTLSSFQPTLKSATQTERFHGLDATRTFALLIGIFHHGIESLVTYVNNDWATQDSQSSIVLDILFYVSHVFRMQTFFLLSGFFVHLLYHRKGETAFIRNRSKRLLLPFLLFWPLLYGLNWSLWVWGIQRVTQLSRPEAIAKLPGFMVWEQGFPLMHLWFLYFLILFCLLVVLVRPIMENWIDPAHRIRLFFDRLLAKCLQNWWGSLALGILMIGPMLGMTDWFGVDTSASGIVPRWASFTVYGLYFTLGWFLHRQPGLLNNFRKFRLVNLGWSVALIGALITINLLYAEPNAAVAQIILAVLNTVYAFASMTTALAFIGYMMVYFSEPKPLIRYLSDSAYWGYLIHLPVVVFFQILVAPYAWHWLLKLGFIFGPSSIILWLTYQYGVRHTWLGALLNGKR